jgi:hypothetical protein
MATKTKMTVLKNSFLGYAGREFHSTSEKQIADLEKEGVAKRVEEVQDETPEVAQEAKKKTGQKKK